MIIDKLFKTNHLKHILIHRMNILKTIQNKMIILMLISHNNCLCGLLPFAYLIFFPIQSNLVGEGYKHYSDIFFGPFFAKDH